MSVRFRVEGFRDIERAMKDLKPVAAKAVARRALKKAAQPIADAGAANAPRLEGYLEDSFAIGTKLTKRQQARYRKRSAVEMHVGPNDPAAVQVEFGNENQPAQPFMRPAWNSEKMNALKILRRELKAEVEKSIARAKRKAERAARR